MCLGRKIKTIVAGKEANAAIVGLKVGDVREWGCFARDYGKVTLGAEAAFPLADHAKLND